MNRRIAVIDIGSNSFHLIIAYIDEDGKIQILKRERKVLRLNFTDQSNRISEEAIYKAVTLLNSFNGIAKHYNAEIKAVATSAVREAENKTEFLQQIYNETKINIDVIDGKKEAELIYSGISQAVNINNQAVLCIDIGGGSTELIIGENKQIELLESLNLGAVRLTQMFFQNSIVNKENIEKCKNYIESKLSKVVLQIKKYNTDFVIGTSGTINSIALIKSAMENKELTRNELNGFSFSMQDLATIQKRILSAKNIDEIKKIKGIEEKRADVIPAGVILLTTIFEILEIKSITISNFALKEGIIANYLFL
jgi:exopolyphosphatase/guanosine-5'-triphosphate,3'-diphosphate pyrophosphatase